MEIIDAFCGIGPWQKRDKLLPYMPADILEIMDHYGIASAIVRSNMAANSVWPLDGNEIVSEAARTSERFIPAFVLAPHHHDNEGTPLDYAEKMRAAGARAAWLWSQSGRQSHNFCRWLVGDLLSMCTEKQIPLFLHTSTALPDTIHEVCRNFPQLRLVIAGLGYNDNNWLYPLLRCHPVLRVCCGNAYIPPLGPERFVKHFGAGRLIFGSGLPHFSPGGLIGYIMYSAISEKDKEKIMAGNIKSLMGEVRL